MRRLMRGKQDKILSGSLHCLKGTSGNLYAIRSFDKCYFTDRTEVPSCCKVECACRRFSRVPSAMGIFLHLPRTPLCALTLEQTFAFVSLSDCFEVALILSNAFKSLGLMASLSSPNVTPLPASNPLLNPLGISDH